MVEICVKKLFGRFDYKFDMGNMKKGVIILSGPNGFGKTVLLDCINAVGMSELSFFLGLKFESFKIKRDEKDILIVKWDNGLRINGTGLSAEEIRNAIKM